MAAGSPVSAKNVQKFQEISRREDNPQSERVVTLYGPTSRSFTTMLVAYLKKKSIVCQPVDIEDKPEFRAIKSIGELPVLCGEARPLFGSRDIIMYYAQQNENGQFEEKVKQWLEPELNAFLCKHFLAKLLNDEASIESRGKQLRKKLKKLSSSNFLANMPGSCSLADLMHLPTIDFIVENAYLFGKTDSFQAWHKKISKNPEWKDISIFFKK